MKEFNISHGDQWGFNQYDPHNEFDFEAREKEADKVFDQGLIYKSSTLNLRKQYPK